MAAITDRERLGVGTRRGILVNGVEGIVCGFMGVVGGTVSFSISPGVILVNRVASRYAVSYCGIILLLAAFLPKLAALLALRDTGTPLPSGAVCISPWTDLTLSGATIRTKAQVDCVLDADSLEKYASYYAGEYDRRFPLISPMFADLSDLPPLLIQMGTDEVLLDDATRCAEEARKAGVDVTLQILDGMFHAFNGGFFDPEDKAFLTQPLDASRSPIASFTSHALGSEMWADVPYNLLPHLHWLTDPNYGHIYYCDHKPKVFDAKIFANGVDPITGIDHPNGWGTIPRSSVSAGTNGSNRIERSTARPFLPRPRRFSRVRSRCWPGQRRRNESASPTSDSAWSTAASSPPP